MNNNINKDVMVICCERRHRESYPPLRPCSGTRNVTSSMLWAPGPHDSRVLGSGAGRRLYRGPRDLTACLSLRFWFAESDGGCVQVNFT